MCTALHTSHFAIKLFFLVKIYIIYTWIIYSRLNQELHNSTGYVSGMAEYDALELPMAIPEVNEV